VLDDGAKVRQRFLLVAGQTLRGELGMRDEHLLQTDLSSTPYECNDLAAPEMTGRQNHIVLCDSFQTASRRLDQVRRGAALLNRMLAAAAAYPRLTDHAGGWHLHYRDAGQPLGAVLVSLIAVGTALHLAGRGMHRLRRCAVDECGAVFADTSRTGRQRYCTARCANRDAVRRHRSRSPARRPTGRGVAALPAP